MFNFIRNAFALVGVFLTIMLLAAWLIVPKSSKDDLPKTEIKFDVFITNRADTLHRSIITTKGECRVERYDRWTYALKTKDSGIIIWKESYPIKIVSQTPIQK